MISVLVADDSVFIRKRITRILESDRRINVVGTAVNGADCIEKIRLLKPDVVTLDVEMPEMNGIEALQAIVNEFSVPVIMLSALTKKGAEVTMKALEIGAVDFIAKPSVADEKEVKDFTRDLILKIRAAALVKAKRDKKGLGSDDEPDNEESSEPPEAITNLIKAKQARSPFDLSKLAVAIGISTGGPKTLMEVIPLISESFPGSIFIAQHIPEGFTKSLSDRLNATSKISVKEAKHGEVVKPGTCYIAPGGHHLSVVHMTLSKGVMLKVSDEPQSALYKPSADVLLSSVATIYGSNSIGVIMTGMGRDGTKGMREIKERGGVTVSEDRSSCVVYGMPKSVEEAGLSDYIAPAREIPRVLMQILKIQG